MEYSGYIEGYFGRELTWKERSEIVNHLSDLKMNTYLLAPKEDPYHRVLWKEPYPDDEIIKIKALSEQGKHVGVNVIPSLAPGLSYDYLSLSDYEILLHKITHFLSLNINCIALLMDDISQALPENCQGHFSSLGEAHGRLLVRLLGDIRIIKPEFKILFCPTIYTDQFVDGKAVDNSYIKDLAKIIPKDIPLLWTGPQVVSETISFDNCGELFELFNGNVILWDNLYANDYCPFRVFYGAYQGRTHEVFSGIRGLLINPTGLFHTDKLLLSVVSDFLNTGLSDDQTWDQIAAEFSFHPLLKKFRKLFWLPFTQPGKEEFDLMQQVEAQLFYEDVIVKGQNPLRLEWYPYLYGLYLDMQMVQDRDKRNVQWFYNRYPAMVSNLLTN